MKTHANAGLLFVLLPVLAACATGQAGVAPDLAANRISLAPEVREMELTSDLAALREFVGGAGPGDRIVVVAGDPASAAAVTAAREIASVTGGSVRILAAPRAGVMVRVTRLRAAVPECPDWSRSSSEDFSNRPFGNFGCADAVNLAAQVADPNDLVRGVAGRPGEARLAVDAVGRLRADKVKPLPPAGGLTGGAPQP